jgi:FlaG/FlaF family flagellin (archaellin)
MLLQVNKKGVSVVIGYVLLIAISIVMSVLVYQWLKTYVPTETLECPEDTSVFIKEASYDCIAKTLTVTLQNNGKFSVGGFFIHSSTNSNLDSIATIDLSSKLTSGGVIEGNSVLYGEVVNALTPEYPNNEKTSIFDVTSYGSTLTEIEIIPLRFQEEDNRKRVVSCSNAEVRESLTCLQ